MKLLLAIVAAATSLTSLVVAQNCSASFSKIDTSSLTSFTAVQLGRDCASGSTLTLEAPGAVSWTFVEVEGLAAPEIYESSSGLVVPFVSSDGTLRFELGSSGNTNVGGVEVLVPSGSISNLYMDENTMSAYVTLLSTMTVDLSATTGDLSLTSASALTFAANCASLDADIIAPSVTLQGVDGASIDLSIKGDVSGFIDGANLQILFEGNPTNVQMGGTNIQVGVSGGGSCSGVSMEGAVKSCSASTDVVTIDSNDCTSTSTILSVNCQTGQVSGGDGDGFDFSNGGNDFNENDDGNGDDNINENDNDNGNGNDDENDNDDRGFLGSTNPNDSGANARVLSFVAGVVLAFAAAGM